MNETNNESKTIKEVNNVDPDFIKIKFTKVYIYINIKKAKKKEKKSVI